MTFTKSLIFGTLSVASSALDLRSPNNLGQVDALQSDYKSLPMIELQKTCEARRDTIIGLFGAEDELQRIWDSDTDAQKVIQSQMDRVCQMCNEDFDKYIDCFTGAETQTEIDLCLLPCS